MIRLVKNGVGGTTRRSWWRKNEWWTSEGGPGRETHASATKRGYKLRWSNEKGGDTVSQLIQFLSCEGVVR